MNTRKSKSMNTNIIELVQNAITSPNFNRGKVFKAIAERLEAANITITKQIKSDLYDAIDTRIKALLPIGKQWTVTACAVSVKLNAEGELIPTGRINTQDTASVLSLSEELSQLRGKYIDVRLKLSKKSDSVPLQKTLRRVRNAIVTRIFNMRMGGVAEDITVADNTDKWLAKFETKPSMQDAVAMPMDRLPNSITYVCLHLKLPRVSLV